MQLPQKAIDEFKKAWKESFGEEISDDRAKAEATPLIGFFELLLRISQREARREEMLKEHPKGFHLTDGTYSCILCHATISRDSSWYDDYGQKCLDCQRALDEGIVPPEVFTDRDSRWLMWELETKFKLHSATVRKMVRKGELNARIILNKEGKPHEYVFLKSENTALTI
jgi:hypothetical protein